jgi:hypothetical protein
MYFSITMELISCEFVAFSIAHAMSACQIEMNNVQHRDNDAGGELKARPLLCGSEPLPSLRPVKVLPSFSLL